MYGGNNSSSQETTGYNKLINLLTKSGPKLSNSFNQLETTDFNIDTASIYNQMGTY